MAVAPKDRPTAPNLTFSQLDAEDTPDPYVYMTKSNHRVVFPDIFDMEADEGEQFLSDVETKRDDEVLQKWLSKEDYEAVKADKLTLRKRMRLLEAVLNYYQSSLGTPGEDEASET